MEFHLSTEVQAIEVAGGQVSGLRTPTGTLRADAYVVACASASVPMLKPLGLDLPNVCLRPAVPHTQVPRVLKSYDTLLMPYTREVVTHPWMSPLKFFEGLASGTPVVASRLGPIPDLVDERHVWLIDPDDHGSLARALRDVASDRPEAIKRAGRAQTLAARDFTWQARARALIEFLKLTPPRSSV